MSSEISHPRGVGRTAPRELEEASSAIAVVVDAECCLTFVLAAVLEPHDQKIGLRIELSSRYFVFFTRGVGTWKCQGK